MNTVKLLLEQIQPGITCASNICDENGRVLVGKGVQLTESFLSGLEDRGITELFVSESDWAMFTGAQSNTKKHRPESKPSERDSRRVDRSQETYSAERASRFAGKIGDTLDLIDGVGTDIDALTPRRVNLLRELPRNFAEMLAEDTDQVLTAANRALNDSLASRCAQFSILAISTGIEMELPDDDVALLGSACLLHDFGLFLMDEKFRNPALTLSAEDAAVYRKHPETTFRFLADFPAISDELRVLAMQVHELPDGSGYPRGIMKNRFHRLTSIASLVEVYLALTGPGPGRPPLVPHDALTFMLFQCSKGLLSPDVMRAFMTQLTLFGIDMQVLLSSGENAKVVRRDGPHYDKPVVAIEGHEEGEFTRLSQTEVSVVAPVPGKHQMRLGRELAASTSLDHLLFI